MYTCINVNRLNAGPVYNLESDQEIVILGDEEEWILTKEQSLYLKKKDIKLIVCPF